MAGGSSQRNDAAQLQPFEAPLFDGFEGTTFSPAGGLYYRDNPEQRAGRVEFQSAVTHRSAGALKLSVRPLWGGESGRSERAEIWERSRLRVPYDRAVWYGFSVRFADPVPQDATRHLIAQWKREIGPTAQGDYSPFFALRLVRGRLFATVETTLRPGDGDSEGDFAGHADAGAADAAAPVWLRPEKHQMRALVATDGRWDALDGKPFGTRTGRIRVTDRGNRLPVPESGWIDFAVMTRPGPDGSGHVELFANDRWIVTVKGDIGHDDPGLGPRQYFKFGPYRAAAKDEWTLYFDNFRRSPDAADVLGREGLSALAADAC